MAKASAMPMLLHNGRVEAWQLPMWHGFSSLDMWSPNIVRTLSAVVRSIRARNGRMRVYILYTHDHL